MHKGNGCIQTRPGAALMSKLYLLELSPVIGVTFSLGVIMLTIAIVSLKIHEKVE